MAKRLLIGTLFVAVSGLVLWAQTQPAGEQKVPLDKVPKAVTTVKARFPRR